jgi:hypothetical protein
MTRPHGSVRKCAEQSQHHGDGDHPQRYGQTAAEKSGERWKDQAQQNEDQQEVHGKPESAIITLPKPFVDGLLFGGNLGIQGLKKIIKLVRRETEIPIGRHNLRCRFCRQHFRNQFPLSLYTFGIAFLGQGHD